MTSTRPFALVLTLDQWLRAAHVDTSIDPVERAVELSWASESEGVVSGASPGVGAGLAFDASCRLYRSVPAEGRVERVLWAAQDPLAASAAAPEPVDVIRAPDEVVFGDFMPAGPAPAALIEPRGLAVDSSERLFIAEAGRCRVLVYNLRSRRLVRVIPLAPEAAAGPRPVDLAARGDTVHALTEQPTRLLRLTAHGAPIAVVLPVGIVSATRIAVSPGGRVAVLDAGSSRVFFTDGAAPVAVSPHTSDIEFETEDILVTARFPGEDFLRVPLAAGAGQLERPHLKARGYDGRGVVRTPDGRIGFWTARGFRNAVAVRLRYESRGRVTTFRLDSGEWQTIWGRVFLDACIPDGSEVLVHCAAADEPPEGAAVARTPPTNGALAVPPFPELSPPMPPVALLPAADPDLALSPIHRRESGRELPWAQPPAADRFATYEAPIQAAAGRYLWITLELRGDTRVTPRVRCVRAEQRSHDYLRRLPRAYSRDETNASFLRRYLAIFDGFLGEVDARGFERAALLDPRASPDELLPWLASFLGLVLDERWSLSKQRTLVAEIADLWRARGTVRGLTRLLEIYLGVAPVLVEHFRLRGPGGAIVGAVGAAASSAVVGGGFRVGGPIGVAPVGEPATDAFASHAHRFSVIIPATLGEEQRAVVTDVLDAHRPAHTIYDVCTVSAGMRVGLGLYVGLSSIVAQSSGFSPLQVGTWTLGGGSTVGRAEPGIFPGATRAGLDSRVG